MCLPNVLFPRGGEGKVVGRLVASPQPQEDIGEPFGAVLVTDLDGVSASL